MVALHPAFRRFHIAEEPEQGHRKGHEHGNEGDSNGSIHMDFDYDDINTFLAGRMNVGIDQTLWDYIQKLDKTRAAKQLKGKTPHKKAPKAED
jgi:hypothetical protein